MNKVNLRFISLNNIKTNLRALTPSDVTSLVRTKTGVKLQSTDIDSIKNVPGGFKIIIKKDCLNYSGNFKIKYRKYFNEG